MEFKNGIISLNSCIKSHVYLVPIKSGYAMIDASIPGTGPSIVAELDTLNIPLEKIQYILITHCDYDHIGGLGYLRNCFRCPIYASKGEIKNSLGKTKMLIDNGILPSWFVSRFEYIDSKDFSILPPNKIDEFEIIDLHGHGFEMKGFLHGDVLFCGDLIQTQNRTIYQIQEKYNIDHDLYIKFLKSINMSKVDLICQGHGKPIKAHPAWEEFLKTI